MPVTNVRGCGRGDWVVVNPFDICDWLESNASSFDGTERGSWFVGHCPWLCAARRPWNGEDTAAIEEVNSVVQGGSSDGGDTEVEVDSPVSAYRIDKTDRDGGGAADERRLIAV